MPTTVIELSVEVWVLQMVLFQRAIPVHLIELWHNARTA